MQGYSLNGYLNAVARRSAKTLLVEGVGDSSTVSRVKQEVGIRVGRAVPGQIDVTEMLSDESLKGLGRKEMIRKVVSELRAIMPEGSPIFQKFGTLTDREWDGIPPGQHAWAAPTQTSPHFVTVGHSIENYFFRAQSLQSYLRFGFPEYLSQDFFDALAARFHAIVGLAVVYSFAMRGLSALSRGGGLITRDHVVWDGGRYQLLDALERSISARQIQTPADFVERANADIDQYLLMNTSVEPGMWLCHGHLGEDAIWACVSKLAEECGVSAAMLPNIERGNREVRFRYLADNLASQHLASSEPLEAAVTWLAT